MREKINREEKSYKSEQREEHLIKRKEKLKLEEFEEIKILRIN